MQQNAGPISSRNLKNLQNHQDDIPNTKFKDASQSMMKGYQKKDSIQKKIKRTSKSVDNKRLQNIARLIQYGKEAVSINCQYGQQKNDQIVASVCYCQGNTECRKKLIFLEDQLRQLRKQPIMKPIIAIYNIEKIIGQVQFYMVQYFDHSLQKLSANQLKQNYIKQYIRFLQEQCFDE